MTTLSNFRREAKRWLKAVRAGDAGELARLHRVHPQAAGLPTLRDTQHAVARAHGYESWAAMRTALERRMAPDSASHVVGFGPAERVAAFLDAACPDADDRGPSNRTVKLNTAMRLLTRHPEIAEENVFTRVVCGDLEGVDRLLEERPDAVTEAGGPKAWPPLLYLCNARLSVPASYENAVAIARALLDRGADPNARYILKGVEDYPYTALTGVLGRGEEEAQTHPHAEALARLLFERGAEPYDGQTLYNVFADHGSRRELGDDIIWLLDLIYTHSVQRGRQADWDDPDWPMLDPWGRGQGAGFLLDAARDGNHVKLTEWLIAHGARPDAVRIKPEPAADDPPAAMLAAIRDDRVDVAARLLDGGLSPDHEYTEHGRSRPLHHAAAADAVRVISLLIERGAEVDARESNWHATPMGFAVYGQRPRALAVLGRVSRDIYNLTFTGNIARLRELLDAEPALAKTVSPHGGTPLMRLPDDETRALEIIDLFLAHGADPAARTEDGKAAADIALERGLDIAAERLRASSRSA